MLSPLIKLAASLAKRTQAPTNSSGLPKRFIGVRIRNSRPRSVPLSNAEFSSVGKTPGAMQFTLMLSTAHSTASDLVKLRTAAFDAQYAVTCVSPTNELRLAMLMILPFPLAFSGA